MKKLLIPFFILGTIAMIIVMGKTGKPLKTTSTPAGILNLEFAFSKKNVDSVFKGWQINTPSSKIDTAKTNTYWDFLFIFFYSGLLFLWSRKLSGTYRDGTGFNKAGKLIAKLALAAGVLDIIENICMLQSLNGNVTDGFAITAAICASVKFTFALIAVMYVFISLPLSAYAKFRNG